MEEEEQVQVQVETVEDELEEKEEEFIENQEEKEPIASNNAEETLPPLKARQETSAEDRNEIIQGPIEGTETKKTANPVFGILWVLTGLGFYVFVNGCTLIGVINSGIAVALGLVSWLLTAGKILWELRKRETPPFVDIFFGLILVIIWITGVILFTFISPFSSPGTGFFSTWICLVLSVYYVSHIDNKIINYLQ